MPRRGKRHDAGNARFGEARLFSRAAPSLVEDGKLFIVLIGMREIVPFPRPAHCDL
jgi:hypothetical protein